MLVMFVYLYELRQVSPINKYMQELTIRFVYFIYLCFVAKKKQSANSSLIFCIKLSINLICYLYVVMNKDTVGIRT